MIVLQVFTEWTATFIEFVLYFSIIHTVAKEHFEKRKQIIYFISVTAVLATGVILLNMIHLSISMVTGIYGIIAMSIGASILYKGNFLGFMFAAFSYLAGLNLVEGSMVKAIGIIWSPEVTEQFQAGFSMLRVYIVVIFKCVDIAVVSCVCILLKKIARSLQASMLSLICSVAAFFSITYLLGASDINKDLEMNVAQSILAAICIFALCAGYFYFRYRQIRQEKEYTVLQNQLLEKNYKAAEDSYESNARLYHDMRNHFSMIQQYLADGNVGEAQEYIEKINGSKAISTERYTGIEAVDYILSQKIEIAKEQSIITGIHAEYPKDCSIDPVDLCTILTNLLDNAIEACAKHPADSARKLDVTIRRIHQFIIIRITNSSMEPPVIHNGKLVTSKKNKEYHGWGMKSVQAVAEKYHGTIEYAYKESLFTVSVMLCYQ